MRGRAAEELRQGSRGNAAHGHVALCVHDLEEANREPIQLLSAELTGRPRPHQPEPSPASSRYAFDPELEFRRQRQDEPS